MPELSLDKAERLALKAQAHALDPVVLLGSAGLTDAVLAEINRALDAHALIKVRVPLDDRNEREAIFAGIADQLGAARVQSIGKLVVLYRPPAEKEEPQASARRSDPAVPKRAPPADKARGRRQT